MRCMPAVVGETAAVTERSCFLHCCVTILVRIKKPSGTVEAMCLNTNDLALADVYHALHLRS